MASAVRFKWCVSLLLLFCTNASASSSSGFSSGSSITVAVATNFKPVLNALSADFTRQTNIKVRISSASTGVLYNQIRQGAPFDVFLSADSERPALLEQQGLIVKDSRATYALGQLVLVSNDKSLPASQAVLENYQGRLAIANPRIAPYGLAAKQTLTHLKLWPLSAGSLIKGSLIKGNSVAQTFQFIHSGNVKMAFVAHAQIANEGFINKNFAGGMWLVPDNYYQPIAQQLVVLKNSKKLKAANDFAKWILAPQQQQQIVKAGYAPDSADIRTEEQ